MTGDDEDLVDDPVLAGIARAIADGTPVAWPAADEPHVHAGLTHQLRTVQTIAHLHRSASEAAVPAAIATPREGWWGHLKIVEVIGRGAFGDVYRAWDSRLDREVALKVIRADSHQPSGPAVSSPFVEEARLLARVHHPNVLTVFGADVIGGRSAMWTELLRGRTLLQVVVEGGRFSAQEAATIGIDLCRALSAVHGAGLLHRDVKAQNVMRVEGGRIVLMDFGAGHEHVGDSGSVDPAGTPVYVAPEILVGQPPTVQSDVYSLGVLLYYLVTTTYPTPGATVAELVEAHRESRQRLLRDVRPDLPADFIEIVERAIDLTPAKRYQTAGAFEAALSRVQTSPVARRRPPKWIWLAVNAGVGTAVLVMLLANGLWSRSGTDPMPAADPRAVSEDRTLELLTSGVARPSPDGRFVAYARAEDIWLWDPRTQVDARQVTQRAPESSEGAVGGVAVSFDGTLVAYTWKTLEGTQALRVIQADGRNPRTILLDDVGVPEPLEWSRDGRYILGFLTRPNGRLDLAMVPTTPGTPVVLQTLVGRRPNASLSPDAQYVVYDAPPTTNTPRRHLMIARTDGSPARVLLAERFDARAPMWTPDGRHVMFISDRSGPSIGWLLPINGGRASGEPLIATRTDLTDAAPIALTSDGQYYYMLELSREVYIRDIDADPDGARPPARVPAASINGHGTPSWSPDGRHVAFVSGPVGGDRTLTIALPDEGTYFDVPLLLSEVGNSATLPQWTPDGRFITIRGRNAAGQQGYFNADVSTGVVTPVLTFDTRGDHGRFQWLPDGRFVYFHKPRGLIARTAAGAETVLHDGPGLVSPIDVSIASIRSVADQQMSALMIDTADGASREVARFSATDTIQLHAWSQDGRELMLTTCPSLAGIVDFSKINVKFWKLRIADRRLVDTGLRLPVTTGWAVAVSPDGRRIAYEPVPGRRRAELHVVQGFLSSAVK